MAEYAIRVLGDVLAALVIALVAYASSRGVRHRLTVMHARLLDVMTAHRAAAEDFPKRGVLEVHVLWFRIVRLRWNLSDESRS